MKPRSNNQPFPHRPVHGGVLSRRCAGDGVIATGSATADSPAPAGTGARGEQSADPMHPRATIPLPGRHGAAFAGVYLFTLFLYARPNDLFPFLGSFPLVKIIAISGMVIYITSKLSAGERLTVRSIELLMLLVIATMGMLLMPLAVSPQDSSDMLTDSFLKTVVIFTLMINLLDSRQRLLSIWKLVVVCGAMLGLGAIKSYAKGEFTMQGLRIEGLVGGIFGNPNDLATALDLLLPLAVVLAMLGKGAARLLYLFFAAVMTIGVMVTFSRGGFLGLLALSGVLLWKLGRGRRLKTLVLTGLVCGVLFAVLPGGYGNRMATIFSIDEDKTGSAQERHALMELAASIAIRRPIIGIGMGNFHIYSYHEKEAHNAYLQIAAELGIIGLLAYLILIVAPLRSLARIEDRTVNAASGKDREMYLLSIGLQAAFVAYIVCSFFSSIQYLWYLYYTAAYAVALRQIHAAEERKDSSPESLALAAQPATTPQPARGVLWPTYKFRLGIR